MLLPNSADINVTALNEALQSISSSRRRTAPLLATGDCSAIDWQFLGLSMPMWCLVFFVAMGLGALYAGFRRRHHHRFHR